jgi:hypothetical protein
MKKAETYSLDEEVIKAVKKECKFDDRNKSDWVNLQLKRIIESRQEVVIVEGLGCDFKKIDDHNYLVVEKPKAKSSKFIPPKQSDIKLFEVNEKLNLSGFFDYYESNGWKVGKNTMKDWKAAARGWSKRQSTYNRGNSNKQDFSDDSTDWVNRDWGLI